MADPIVVGLTEAPASHRALEWAAKRAAAHRLPLKLISVIGGAVGAIGEDRILDSAVAEARERVEAAASALPRLGLKVLMRVDRGNPVAVLTDASAHASTLVIGSDYRAGGPGPSRGAHGMRIAAGAHCPVVVVPDVDVSSRSGVVVGVDGSPVSEKAIAFAAAEADRLGEPLIAVSVWTPMEVTRNMGVYPVEYLDNLAALTDEAQAVALAGLHGQYPDLEIVRRVERGYPSHVINEIAAGARLAVVGSHGRGTLARFLMGSISHEVLARVATVTAVVR